MGNHRLIRRDQALACAKRLPRQIKRRPIRAADQFNHDIHIIAPAKVGHSLSPGNRSKIEPAILGFVARMDGCDFNLSASARFYGGAIFCEQAEHTNANGAKACNTD
jgi:hypothetical protein